MRRNSRRLGRGLVLAALTVVVSLPGLARAQQTGLFPLAPIKRQRVPCDQEDPIYKTYKHQYFGYHPTCWRQFPAGWGCPSPNGPDKEKSFKELPPTAGERTDSPPEGEAEEGMGPQPPGTRPAVPAVPPGTRSPFEDPFDPDKPATPPRNPRGNPAPLPTPPGDPFELDKPDAPAAPKPGQTRPATPGAATNGPELSAPADQPGPAQGARSTRNDSADVPNDREDVSPMLALPRVNLPPIDDPGVPFGTKPPAPAGDVAANANTTPPAGATATPRRGFLSGLFNNLGLNWVRR
jgi:hypothetical protein